MLVLGVSSRSPPRCWSTAAAGEWTVDGTRTSFPDAARGCARGSRRPSTARGDHLAHPGLAANGDELFPSRSSRTARRAAPAGATRLQLFSKPSGYDTSADSSGSSRTGSARVVNHVGLDTYLRGVVPVEMPVVARGGAPAQVIAARSYAVKGLNPGTGVFDVYEDTRSQVYRGIEGERTRRNRLIAASRAAIRANGDVIKRSTSRPAAAPRRTTSTCSCHRTAPPGSPVRTCAGIADRSPAAVPYDADAPRSVVDDAPDARTAVVDVQGRPHGRRAT